MEELKRLREMHLRQQEEKNKIFIDERLKAYENSLNDINKDECRKRIVEYYITVGSLPPGQMGSGSLGNFIECREYTTDWKQNYNHHLMHDSRISRSAQIFNQAHNDAHTDGFTVSLTEGAFKDLYTF